VQGAPAINLKPKATATVQSEQAKIRNFKMALAIATNNAALNAAASASSVNREMETSMARLSSGKRINSASDDAAGVAISSRLSAEIRGTDQAIRNALDGQALIDTAEGAHKEIENILQRMREISVQAANDTNNDQDRVNLQAEIDALVTEIDRIASTTTWAGEKLMEDPLGTEFKFQVGAKTSGPNQIGIDIKGMGSHALGLEADPADPVPAAPADYLVRQATVSGAGVVTANNGNTLITLEGLGAGAVGAQANVTYTTTDPASVNAAVAAINAGTANTNIQATVGADGSGNAGKIVLSHNDGSGADHTTKTGLGTHTNISNLQGLVAFDTANTVPFATMDVSGTTGILTFNENATAITLVLGKTTATGAAGAKSSVTIDATANLQTAVDAINDGGGSAGSGDGTTEHGYTASIVAAPGGGSLAGTIKLVKGSAASGITQTALADFINNGATGVGAIAKKQPAVAGPPQDMDVKTLPKALEAIVAVDEAIKTVNIQRSTLGAVSNRLSHTINNLTNISTNLSAAQGGIEDADFAHETTMLAKNQILQQASTAMLAQANASKQNVLSLLQG
jgi:flagellin